MIDHIPIERSLGILMNTRRVDKNRLIDALGINANQVPASGLGFTRRDTDLLSKHVI